MTTYEKELLGTAGTLLKNHKLLEGDLFLLIHVDNATDFNLQDLINAHFNRPRECIMTMLTFSTQQPKNCGVVVKDTENIMVDYFEKVNNPPSNIANAAIFVFGQELVNHVKTMASTKTVYDFSRDIIPSLKGRVYTHHTDELFLDIGNLENLKKARKYLSDKN